jgi:hypothetical protein
LAGRTIAVPDYTGSPPAKGRSRPRSVKFGSYLKWPERAYAAADSPFVIAIIGPAVLARSLERRIRQRRLAARAVLDDPEPVPAATLEI